MKKLLLSFAVLAGLFAHAQTATNFNVNDCQGNNHDLFTELDAGKVIVLCWVMPCPSCVAPAQTAHNIVNSYSVSNPGKVLFYLCDDYGSTSCANLNSWAATHSITVYTAFSNSNISMSDYGTDGMPKIVVLGGGTSHMVFDNQNNTLNSTTFTDAIDDAISASPTGIRETENVISEVGLWPNPAGNHSKITFTSQKNQSVEIQIFNLSGQNVKSFKAQSTVGKTEIKIDTEDLPAGTYFVKIGNTNFSESLKLVIAK